MVEQVISTPYSGLTGNSVILRVVQPYGINSMSDSGPVSLA